MGAVFLKLLHMSLAASGLVIAVMVLRLIFKRAPKAIHCALWALVALRLLLPFSVESSLSLIPEDVASGNIVSEWTNDYIDDVDIHRSDSVYYDAAIGAGREPLSDGEGGYYVVTKHDQLGEPATIGNTVVPILGWIWLVGCVVMLLYAVVSFLRIRKRVQVSLPLRDNIWRSEAVDSPFILGFFRPKIYLPYDMAEAQMHHVIAHEESHLRRRDHWWKPLGFLLLAVYWFNPLLWVAYILLCRDIELACDERVIRDMDASAKKAYSEALLSCSLPRHMVAACPLAFGEVGVKKRITSVLNYKKPAFWVMVVAILACIVVAVCFLTNPKSAIDGKVYVYEKDGHLGYFTITLFEDGTFHYTEGMVSGYYATGKWLQEGNMITLVDGKENGHGLVNFFMKDGDDLVFLAEDSSNFIYIKVQDGERFVYTFDIEKPSFDEDVDGMQTMITPGYAVVKDALTEDEIASFNELLAPIVYDKQGGIIGASPWSCFFTSYYSDVRALDFAQFMRYFSGDGSKANAAEFELLKGTEGWPFSQEDTLETIPVPIHKYPTRLVDMILSEYAGITTADVDTSGVAYLAEYDAYYNYTSDFGAGSFQCTRGERVGDLLYLYEETEQHITRLTLREHGDSYRIVAFQPMVNGEAVEGEFVTVAALFDTILSSPADAAKPADYLKAHPNEHTALLTDENTTLRYIFTQFLTGNQPEPLGQLMRTVLDELAPEAQLRLYTETGQEYFDEWIAAADSVATQHGLEWLEENQPALYLALQIRSEIYGHSSPVNPVSLSELEGAVWFTPEDIHDIEYMVLACADGQLLSVSTEGHTYVETCLSNATEWWTPACPFDSTLFFHRADGTVGKILTSGDDCWMLKSNETYYRVADWDDPAYETNKEKYFSYFVPVSKESHTATPQLPDTIKLDAEVQQAACDAILASLSTGWWTAQELDPAYEAAAFTCFHHETVGNKINLYGFGGYFTQDSQGNAANEWSSFTIVTLNKSTLDLIQVWWPGDGAYHDMSISENFPDDLAEAAIMISPDDYQRLQTALRKQAAENMSPTHLE